MATVSRGTKSHPIKNKGFNHDRKIPVNNIVRRGQKNMKNINQQPCNCQKSIISSSTYVKNRVSWNGWNVKDYFSVIGLPLLFVLTYIRRNILCPT